MSTPSTPSAPEVPIVVVGVDMSDTAKRAAQRAAEIARALGGRLHLVSAVKEVGLATMHGPGSDAWQIDLAGPTEDYLNDMASRWPDLHPTTACAAGKPVDVIVRQAEKVGATLIVVGNKRMTGITRMLGAVAADVAHHAHCDVYIANTVG